MGDKETAAKEFDEKTLKKAEFCLKGCPMCRIGREKGKGVLFGMVKVEAKLKLCPWCRAYEKVYGVPAYEKPPQA